MTGLCSTYSDVSLQYQYVSEPKTWKEAQEHCRKVHIDLATVENMKDMTSLLKIVDSQYMGKVWTGLVRGTEQHWQWSLSDISQPITYTNWHDSVSLVGTAACAMMCEGEWCVDECEVEHYFVCFDGK